MRKDLYREALLPWLTTVPAGTVVAMEACSSAHHWARACTSHDLLPKLMATQFVTPFPKSAGVKNNRNDAEAIATASRQRNMRFVPVNYVDQHVVSLHQHTQLATECREVGSTGYRSEG